MKRLALVGVVAGVLAGAYVSATAGNGPVLHSVSAPSDKINVIGATDAEAVAWLQDEIVYARQRVDDATKGPLPEGETASGAKSTGDFYQRQADHLQEFLDQLCAEFVSEGKTVQGC